MTCTPHLLGASIILPHYTPQVCCFTDEGIPSVLTKLQRACTNKHGWVQGKRELMGYRNGIVVTAIFEN